MVGLHLLQWLASKTLASLTMELTAKTTVMDPRVNLDDDAHSVFANGGTALVIHEKADDFKTDPAGNAGARIACGVISK